MFRLHALNAFVEKCSPCVQVHAQLGCDLVEFVEPTREDLKGARWIALRGWPVFIINLKDPTLKIELKWVVLCARPYRGCPCKLEAWRMETHEILHQPIPDLKGGTTSTISYFMAGYPLLLFHTGSLLLEACEYPQFMASRSGFVYSGVETKDR